MMRRIVRRILPRRARAAILNGAADFRTRQAKKKLAALEHRWSLRTGPGSAPLLQYDLHFNDGRSVFGQFKLIFHDRIYHFETNRPDPLILDCGGNLGISLLYFKHLYPSARILSFEPDPSLFPYLQRTVTANRLSDVRLVQAALTRAPGTLTFYSDGQVGSCLEHNRPKDIPDNWIKCEVPCVRLRDYITEPVDFLKMNIEGAEWDALSDCDERLRCVRQMVIEYHHWKGLPRTLHQILELLHRHGFTYLINHLDYHDNPSLRPPFQLTADTRYYLLIFAKRLDESTDPRNG